MRFRDVSLRIKADVSVPSLSSRRLSDELIPLMSVTGGHLYPHCPSQKPDLTLNAVFILRHYLSHSYIFLNMCPTKINIDA